MGTLHMVRAFLPGLVSRPEAHVANLSSMDDFFPFPGQTMYGASKAAGSTKPLIACSLWPLTHPRRRTHMPMRGRSPDRGRASRVIHANRADSPADIRSAA